MKYGQIHVYDFILKCINLYKYKTRYLYHHLRVTKGARTGKSYSVLQRGDPWKNGNAHMSFPPRVFPKMNSEGSWLLACMLLCNPHRLESGLNPVTTPSHKLNMAKVTVSVLRLGYRKTAFHLAHSHWRQQAAKGCGIWRRGHVARYWYRQPNTERVSRGLSLKIIFWGLPTPTRRSLGAVSTSVEPWDDYSFAHSLVAALRDILSLRTQLRCTWISAFQKL